ncbi:hypothetical protein HDU93_002662 [Gonapodya sp. JEL0774]|nr:hypothetical protein HDU93_002662 [Gonapodya sp. JEL0774]
MIQPFVWRLTKEMTHFDAWVDEYENWYRDYPYGYKVSMLMQCIDPRDQAGLLPKILAKELSLEQLRAMIGANTFGIAIEKLPNADFFKGIYKACGDLKEINPKVPAILKPSALENKEMEKKILSHKVLKGQYHDHVNAAIMSVDLEGDQHSISLIKSA